MTPAACISLPCRIGRTPFNGLQLLWLAFCSIDFDLHLLLQRDGSGWTGLESIASSNVQG